MLTGKVPYEGDRSTVIFNKINEVDFKFILGTNRLS